MHYLCTGQKIYGVTHYKNDAFPGFVILSLDPFMP